MKKNNALYGLIATLLILLSVLTIYKNKDIEKIEINDNNYGYEVIEASISDINTMVENKETFFVFTYNSFCNFSIPCDTIIKGAMENSDLKLYTIKYPEYKETLLYDKVKYAPSLIIVSEGKVKYYLDANSDSDIDLYQNVDKLYEWINNRIIKK